MNGLIRAIVKISTTMLMCGALSGCIACVATGGIVAASKVVTDQRSTGNMIDDTVLKTKIWKRFFADSEKRFRKIDIEVTEGRVLLTGVVSQEEDAFEAVKLVWGIRGVKEVINEITPAKPLTTWDKSQDLLIKSRIKSQYLITGEFKSTNYTVTVRNKEVYLFGIAENNKERNTAIDIARKVRGVEKVVSYVILKTDQRRD